MARNTKNVSVSVVVFSVCLNKNRLHPIVTHKPVEWWGLKKPPLKGSPIFIFHFPWCGSPQSGDSGENDDQKMCSNKNAKDLAKITEQTTWQN